MKKHYKSTGWFLFLIFIYFCYSLCARSAKCASDEKELIIEPPVISKALNNPCMGLMIPSWKNELGGNRWYNKVCSIAYTRWTWATLEPQKGKYKFFKLKKWLVKCKSHGLRPAFRIMSSTLNGTATPCYVFREGVPGVIHRQGKQVDPVYWNSLYMQLYEHFVQALGRFLDGGRGIEFIDMGGIGVWGEMHFGLWIDGMWTEEQLTRHGYSHEKLFETYKRMINIYKRYLPNTRLFLNISQFSDIAAYAAQEGVGLRFDGLTTRYAGTLTTVSKLFRKYGVNNLHGTGVPCLYEFAKKENNLNALKESIDIALQDPISYLNLNFARLNDVAPNARLLIKTLVTKVGYRLVLKKVVIEPGLYDTDSCHLAIHVKHIWENIGVAPCYRNFQIIFVLVDNGNKVVAKQKLLPSPPTSVWEHGKRIELESEIPLYKRIEGGEYYLKVYVEDPNRTQGHRIKLGIVGEDKLGRYLIAPLRIRIAPYPEINLSYRPDPSDKNGVSIAIQGKTYFQGE